MIVPLCGRALSAALVSDLPFVLRELSVSGLVGLCGSINSLVRQDLALAQGASIRRIHPPFKESVS